MKALFCAALIAATGVIATAQETKLGTGVTVTEATPIKALIEKGLVKIGRFSRNQHKAAYAYILTPRGIQEKVEVTYRFLKRMMAEHDALTQEIERLHGELNRIGLPLTEGSQK